jgi:hypothetical protein
MFKKSRKDTIVDQAQELVHDISEVIAPRLAEAKSVVAPKLADARDVVAPRLADARDVVAPRLADVRDQAAPYVDSARERLVKDVVPAVQQAIDDAREQAAPVAQEARRRGALAAAALRGEQVEPEPEKTKVGRGRALLLIVALSALGALVAKKLTGGGKESDNWQSSYTPTPAPATSTSATSPMAGTHAADVPVNEAAGASPGEAISDAAVEPHPITTPDSPAEDVDVSEVDDPRV